MIDLAPLERPTWADADAQLPNLLRDMGFDSGPRDDEIKAAFQAALNEIDGPRGWLGRSLVPAVRRAIVNRNPMFLPLPPVIEIIGFERLVGNDWSATEVEHRLEDGDRLYVSMGGGAVRAVYHAGFLDTDVPANVTVALRLMARQTIDGYDQNRDRAVRSLLQGLKVYG